ncbi:MAG: DsbA family protein [SAR202 cluster bacterium]|nr:DsbA family protein [SAR202 cluster bacterium]
MGLERVDRLREDYDNIEIEGKAFLLRPDIPKEGRPRRLKPGEEPNGPLGEPLKSSAEEAGLIMRRALVTPYTMYALEATEFAKEQGKFDEFHLGMYKALWEDSKDLGDFDVIRGVAEECDLDWKDLHECLESRHYEETVMGQFQEAVNYGITGIPGFIIGNVLFTGARPYGIFKAVTDKVIGQRNEG